MSRILRLAPRAYSVERSRATVMMPGRWRSQSASVAALRSSDVFASNNFGAYLAQTQPGGVGPTYSITLSAVENIEFVGGSGKDTVYRDAGNDVLRGEGGNDILSAGIGADTLIGGDGDDT